MRDLFTDYCFTDATQIAVAGPPNLLRIKKGDAADHGREVNHGRLFAFMSCRILAEKHAKPSPSFGLQSLIVQVAILQQSFCVHFSPGCYQTSSQTIPGLVAHFDHEIARDPSTGNVARLSLIVMEEFVRISLHWNTSSSKKTAIVEMFQNFWTSMVMNPDLATCVLNSLDEVAWKFLKKQDEESLDPRFPRSQTSLMFVMFATVGMIEKNTGQLPSSGISNLVYFLNACAVDYTCHVILGIMVSSNIHAFEYLEYLIVHKPKICSDLTLTIKKTILKLQRGDLTGLLSFADVFGQDLQPDALKSVYIKIQELSKGQHLRLLNIMTIIQKAQLESESQSTNMSRNDMIVQYLSQEATSSLPISPLDFPKHMIQTSEHAKLNPLLIEGILDAPSASLQERRHITRQYCKRWLELSIVIPFDLFKSSLKEIFLFYYPCQKARYLDFAIFELFRGGRLFIADVMTMVLDLIKVRLEYGKELSPFSSFLEFISTLNQDDANCGLYAVTAISDHISEETSKVNALLAEFLRDSLSSLPLDARTAYFNNIVKMMDLGVHSHNHIVPFLKRASAHNGNDRIMQFFCRMYMTKSGGLSDRNFTHPLVFDLIIRLVSNIDDPEEINALIDTLLVSPALEDNCTKTVSVSIFVVISFGSFECRFFGQLLNTGITSGLRSIGYQNLYRYF